MDTRLDHESQCKKNNLYHSYIVNEKTYCDPYTRWSETNRENNPKYLGITFDPRLTWKTHTLATKKD